MSKSVIICFEGPDKSGKTTIAKEMSRLLNIPYFKNSREHGQKKNGETRLLTKYAIPFFLSFLQQVECQTVVDRCYPSEWVYAQVEERSIDMDVLREIDEHFAQLRTAIIVCMKQSYDGLYDDLAPTGNAPVTVQGYYDFIRWTHVPNVLLLDTTDEDLAAQCGLITQFLDQRGLLS